MNNVVITSAGRRVELLQAWKQSVAKLFGPNAKIYANDLQPALSAACQVADQHTQICGCTNPGYANQLLEQCLEHKVRLVIPTIDTELLPLAKARKAFEAAGIHIVISDQSLIRQCRDKRLTTNLFSHLSIETPALLDSSHLTFPCFMKPVSGSCSQGIKCIPSSEHLSASDLANTNNLFQELMPKGWIEYTADLYYTKAGDLRACVPRQRLEARGGEISKGITRKDNVYSYLKEHLKSLPGARGVITIQIFTDPARENFLGVEINPRFGGGYPMSHAAGVDYPTMLLREYLLNEDPAADDDWKENLLMLRHDAMVFSTSSPADEEIP